MRGWSARLVGEVNCHTSLGAQDWETEMRSAYKMGHKSMRPARAAKAETMDGASAREGGARVHAAVYLIIGQL